jgi:hypothetical protein
MPRFDLDALIRGFQYAAGNAQRAVRRQQERALKGTIDASEEGKPDGVMGIPVISLQDARMMEISECSFEFACTIDRLPHQEVRDSPKLIVIPRRRARKHKKGIHVVKVTLRDLDSGEGDVTVDGVVLKEMSDLGARSVNGEGSCESRYLLSEDELNQLLQEDRGRARRLLRWKTLLACFLIGLLIAAIAIVVIRLGS